MKKCATLLSLHHINHIHYIMALQLPFDSSNTKLCSQGLYGICSELLRSCHLEVVGLLSSDIPVTKKIGVQATWGTCQPKNSLLQGLTNMLRMFSLLHLFVRVEKPKQGQLILWLRNRQEVVMVRDGALLDLVVSLHVFHHASPR